MNRRHLFINASATALAVVLPAAASATPSSKDQVEALHARLIEAGRFYEDNISYDAYVSYFNGVLAGYGGLSDWVVDTSRTGKISGHMVDIAVRFDGASEYTYYPVQFSSDYWERGDRSTWLAKQSGDTQ